MKVKELENSIKLYYDELYGVLPCLFKYLKLNNEIASYILDIFYKQIVPPLTGYQRKFSKYDSIELAFEILSSIEPSLATKFRYLIEKEKIYFITSRDKSLSYTYSADGEIYSAIYNHNNICTTLVLIHEFFHNIHLEQYNGMMENKDWYFYTEVFAIMGELYGAFYLLNEKKDLTNDIKSYLCDFFESLVDCSDKCLITGTIIDIYKQKLSLSKRAIKEYVKEEGLSKAYENILSIKKENNDDYLYHQEVPYIFAFPIAFQLAANILVEPEYKNKFVEMFKNIAKFEPEEWFKELEVSSHLTNLSILNEIMNAFYSNLVDIYGESNSKMKKLGEL